jgi:hypothetical protein
MHEHPHHHDHDHDHDHDHHHARYGHNGGPADHLHSHRHGHSGHESAEELKVLTSAFVDGFRTAADKTSYLRLAGIPFQRRGTDGLTLHLVDASIVANWQIGTASPAFATRELAYLPFPGSMVTSRETMTLTYVSLTERADVDLVQILAARSVSPSAKQEVTGAGRMF